MPFTLKNLKADPEDVGSNFDGPPEAGPDGLEILVIGAPNLGDSPREDVEGRRDWWAD